MNCASLRGKQQDQNCASPRGTGRMAKDQNGKSYMCYFIFTRGGQQSVLPPRGVAWGH